MATSSPIWASDLAKLYPEKIVEAKNLYPLAKSFFTGPGSLPPGETLTPEMLKSPERQAAYYKFRRLLGLAIDAEYDISYLEEFGLKKAKRGYYVDFSQYPQWATVESLFLGLRTTRDFQSFPIRTNNVQVNTEKIGQYLNTDYPYTIKNHTNKSRLVTFASIFYLCTYALSLLVFLTPSQLMSLSKMSLAIFLSCFASSVSALGPSVTTILFSYSLIINSCKVAAS